LGGVRVEVRALEKLEAIDDEQDRAIEACKAPVRRTK
jgi:hypothetical protein